MTAGMDTTTVNDVVLASGAKGAVIEGIGFLIVVVVLARYIVPLVGKTMAARQDVIARQLADSEAAGQKLAEAQAAYDNAVAEAKVEAERLRADAMAQHEAIVSEAAAAAQTRADEITARATEALEAERDTAVRSLQAEIASMAVELAERQVIEALGDDARQRRVTERFLAELESGNIKGATAGTTSGTGGRSE